MMHQPAYREPPKRCCEKVQLRAISNKYRESRIGCHFSIFLCHYRYSIDQVEEISFKHGVEACISIQLSMYHKSMDPISSPRQTLLYHCTRVTRVDISHCEGMRIFFLRAMGRCRIQATVSLPLPKLVEWSQLY